MNHRGIAGGTAPTSASLRHDYHRPPPALKKVLVANRGEIACRVIRTCRQWGIPTVAIYSSVDTANALHCRMADECYLVGTGPTATESYLLTDAILDIAATTQADAIHPGYGFLSEQAAFSAAVAATVGLFFVGPPAHAMEAMASKSRSKAIMEAAGVPTTPGYYFNSNNENTDLKEEEDDDEFLYHQAVAHVGFPLLIKAVAGGGGRGMRLVEDESQFKSALSSCRGESLASFGDDRVLLERYLRRPRHVEVQVMADSHGNCVHLMERDCSLQRRHQKVIEEAPASDLPLSIRSEMGEMAKRAASAVGYVNAGTVEFLVDTASMVDNPDNPSFYFCEMNTRLQVEHPITELITGIDLVEWQLRIAAGETLPIVNQMDIAAHGHAFEARIYAEQPERNFTPATGTIWHHQPPIPVNQGAMEFCADGNPHRETKIRVDAGLQVGQQVSVFYDSMLAKLISHGPDRTQALDALVAALKSYQIAGVATNIDFLIRCAQHPTFGVAGAITTAFLEDHAKDVHVGTFDAVVPKFGRAAGVLAVLWRLENRVFDVEWEAGTPGTVSLPSRNRAPWSSHWGSWRMGGDSARAKREIHSTDGVCVTCISNADGSFDLSWSEAGISEDVFLRVDGYMNACGTMNMIVDGSQRFRVKTVIKKDDLTGRLHIRMWPEGRDEYFWSTDVEDPLSFQIPSNEASGVGNGKANDGIVRAPMPGKISRINFAVGDSVEAGDAVVVMEAMKMEHACVSLCSGILTEIMCQPADIVDDDAVLFVVAEGSKLTEALTAVAS